MDYALFVIAFLWAFWAMYVLVMGIYRAHLAKRMTPWVLADNTVAQVIKAELMEALKLSGTKMAELWVKPYV